jgi:arylsulfatase A
VPFIVKWPKHIKEGSKSDAIFNQIDILKTLTTIAKGTLISGFKHDSYDFSKLWLGDTTNIRSSCVQNTFESKYALRFHEWLYINAKDGYHSRRPEWVEDLNDKTEDSVQLFNLKEDIGQKINLATTHPEIVIKMQEELEKIREDETFTEK